MKTALAFALSLATGTPDVIHFLIGLVIMVCVIACVIILVRWLLALSGVAIPQPLLLVVGIVLFLVFLLWLLNWTGLYRW